MASFTTNKNLEKPANGEYVDQWDVPLNGDMNIIDAAFGGVTSLNATSGSANLSVSQYQKFALNVTGAMSASVTYTIPSGVGGYWVVRNATTDATGGPWSVTIASGGGGSNVTALRDKNILIWSDGTNIRNVDENVATIGTVTSVAVSGGTTGLTANGSPITTNGTITLGGVLNVASGGTNLTAFGTGVSGALSANTTGSGGMVLQSNATLITPAIGTPSSGNLVNTTGLPIANTTGTLAVDRGGTGLATLTANNLMVGNGTSAVSLLSPGTSGNVVTSNGTAWISQALTSSANTQTFNANGTWTKPSGNFTTVQVQMWGAGGGGGRGGDTSSAAVGGGGGGFGILNLPYSIMPNTATVTVGVGGAGGSVGTANGTAGGNTTFVFSNATLFVSGGEGGTALATPAGISSAQGSDSLNFNSSPQEGGGDSARLSDATTLVAAQTRTFAGAGGGACTASANNAGGTSIFGGSGGTGANDAVNGGNGSAPGGGGGGTETGTGGSGGNGRVIVLTF